MPTRPYSGTLLGFKPALMLAACATALIHAAPASAETLEQALAAAYDSNPQIRGEEARLRASDETLAIAQSGYRPTLTNQEMWVQSTTETKPHAPSDGTVKPNIMSLTASEPLFDGFQTPNNVREADANIRAERENLRNVQQNVLLAAATAYMNVVRDRQTVRVRDQNVQALSEELRSVKARFDVGEVTRTDVEQARATLAAAQSADATARGALRNSEAGFALAVGHQPGPLLEAQAPLRYLPGSLDEAVASAQAARPTVVQAAYLEQAANHQIRSLTGQLLPQWSLQASLTRTADPAKRVEESTTNKIETVLTVPIYEAGNVRAQIREAKENRQGLLENIEQARLQAQNDAVTAWSLLQAARAQLQADTVQVQSATIALQGTRAELQVGQRTELDVLTSIQTLLAAQVAVVSDKHDIVVNAYTLLATMGRLTPDQIQLGVALYDVEQHYNETNGKWLDIRVSREEGYAGFEVLQDQHRWIPDPTRWHSDWMPTIVTGNGG